jgi:predicted acylesterase/phospholipase RssA
MIVGLVLGGGGARGNFQVGVVRYLYQRNVRPAVIAGTSVGAINAIKLAVISNWPSGIPRRETRS